ncbi:hypothetical protein [Streptomyces yangpuensis]|uniref:hypothetical protein n=1 Tax=Streptomyces yangpuensis TaxID=1648182 RepID=UPI0036544EA3
MVDEPATPHSTTLAVSTDAVPPKGAGCIQLVQDAIGLREVKHGRHVADLLAERGYFDEAERIGAEVRAQNGHLSARQALRLLEQVSGAP